MVRLAIVDSDSGFVRVLVRRLDAMGWEHRVLATPPSLAELAALRLNAIVVDPAVLGPHALHLIEQTREAMPSVGLVVCAGRSTVAERVRGLRLGADDWLTKPCHPEEVVARVEALLRRGRQAAAPAEAGPMVAGELEVRPDRFEAFVGPRGANLTRREFELLHLLAGGRGQVLEREEIYRRVWGYQMAPGDRSVDVFVRKLRTKLRTLSPGWAYIHTHFGIGYRFQPEPRDVVAAARNADAEGHQASAAVDETRISSPA